MTTTKISRFQKDYTVKVGQVLSYTYETSPSVGNNSSYEIEEDAIICLQKEEEVEEEGSTPEISGGMTYWVTLYFEALKEGKSNVMIHNYFRGDLEESIIFEVTVLP